MESQTTQLVDTTTYTIAELAEELGKSEPTVKAWLDTCKIEGIKDTSGEHGKNRLMLYPVTSDQLISFKEKEKEKLKTKQVIEKQGKIFDGFNQSAKLAAVNKVVEELSDSARLLVAFNIVADQLEKYKARVADLEAVNTEQSILLDDAKQWCTTLRIDKEFGNKEKADRIDWYPLKAWHTINDIEFRKVPDARYGEVNSYHRDAWKEVYGIDINAPTKETVHEVPLQYRRKAEQKALLTLAQK